MEPDRNLSCGETSTAADVSIDDEKVEKFYEIIRSYKEARDRHGIAMPRSPAADVFDSDGGDRIRMKKSKLGDPEQSIWIPAFKLEDFAPAEQRCSSVIPSESSSGEIEKEKRMREDAVDIDGGGLDLNLKL